MPLNFTLEQVSPLMALVFGVLVLLNPKFLSVLVGIYMIVTGLIGLGIIKL